MGRWVVLGGLAALLATGYFANYSNLTLPGLRSARVISVELQRRAEQALTLAGADWASVKMDGQIATLSGEARTEEERDAAIRALFLSSWGGGPWYGGIVAVANAVVLSPAQSPFSWNAIMSDGRQLRITGFVPSEGVKADLYNYAQRLFPSGVVDDSVIARGAPKGDWPAAVKWGLSLLNKLSAGEAAFADLQFNLRGVTDQARIQAYVQNGVSTISQPFAGQSDIALVGEGAPPPVAPVLPDSTATVVPTPAQPVTSFEPEALTRSAAAKACQVDIDYARENSSIAFDSATATLRPSSFDVLNKVAEIANDCPALKLIISGHTDNSGSPDLNKSLSRARAKAVADYIVGRGIDRRRLNVRGYGAEKPVDTNDTDDGKARNRRIDITVID